VAPAARGDVHPKRFVCNRFGAIDLLARTQRVEDVRDEIDSSPRRREPTVERLSQIQAMHDGFDDGSSDELVDPHRPERRRADEDRIYQTRLRHRDGAARRAEIQDLSAELLAVTSLAVRYASGAIRSLG
jgi:hypothetical protein